MFHLAREVRPTLSEYLLGICQSSILSLNFIIGALSWFSPLPTAGDYEFHALDRAKHVLHVTLA